VYFKITHKRPHQAKYKKRFGTTYVNGKLGLRLSAKDSPN